MLLEVFSLEALIVFIKTKNKKNPVMLDLCSWK